MPELEKQVVVKREPKLRKGLKDNIMSLSDSKVFSEAVLEWIVTDTEIMDRFYRCPCNQAIKELCYLTNKHNGKKTAIGNCCVKHFIDNAVDELFISEFRILSDITDVVLAKYLTMKFAEGIINTWEYLFYADTMETEILTDKQLLCRMKVNVKMLKKADVIVAIRNLTVFNLYTGKGNLIRKSDRIERGQKLLKQYWKDD